MTGLTMLAGPELGGKYLELLKEAAPGVSRVAALWNPLTAPEVGLLKEAGTAARVLGLELQPVSARRPEEIEGAFAAMSRERANGLIVMPDALFLSLRVRVAELAGKARLPAVYGFRENVEAGGLMSYGASLPACSDGPLATWLGSSREPSPSSNPPGLSWSLTLRRPGRSD